MKTTRCLTCGRTMGVDLQSYERHLEQYHALDGYNLKIKPIRTTDRSKTEIVRDMEKTFEKYIVVTDTLPVQRLVSVSAKYCGPDGKVCVWEDNGWEMCGPCVQIRSAKSIAESRVATFPNSIV